MPETHVADDNPENILGDAATRIRNGATAIYPTETAYAVGGDALNRDVIEAVYDVKQRPPSKGLTTIVASVEMAEQYCRLTAVEKKLCNVFMPGPLTLIADKKDTVPDALNTDFVFRISSSPLARTLSEKTGRPVIATSANLSDAPTSYSVEDINPQIREHVDVILDKGGLEQRPVSTIVRVKHGYVDVVREGAIPGEKLKNVALNG